MRSLVGRFYLQGAIGFFGGHKGGHSISKMEGLFHMFHILFWFGK